MRAEVIAWDCTGLYCTVLYATPRHAGRSVLLSILSYPANAGTKAINRLFS